MFKVGDKVRIISDLNIDMDNIVKEMMEYAGKETTVNKISYGTYELEIDNGEWEWSDEMLEKVETGIPVLTAKEYLETRTRMLKSTKDSKCNRDCKSCPFQANNSGEELDCDEIEYVNPKRAIEIVQKWGEEHLVKTLKDKLLEKFPDAQLSQSGTPNACAEELGFKIKTKCEDTDCDECWGRPYIDEFEEWLNA